MYVNTAGAKGFKKIEILGLDKAYMWRADVVNSRDISLESMRISSLGPPNTIRDCIPGTFNLYLDKNLLYSWDQYFEIIGQLPYLRIIVLNGNKFRRLPPNYFEGKDLARLTHTSLSELVFIDMGLDWEQVQTLAPAIRYVEQLHLVRNNCSKICSQFQIPREEFKLLKFVNLEGNGIESWDEVIEFRHLENLKRLTLNKNSIKNVYYKPGFKQLYILSMEDNLIDNWKSIDELNEYVSVRSLRINGNPILTPEVSGERARECAIARLENVTQFNGTRMSDTERKDFEIYYLNNTCRQFLKDQQEEYKFSGNEEPKLCEYMN